jgi:tRNA-modifying protein YgfZ
MPTFATVTNQLQALEERRAFSVHTGLHAILVRGADARGWLHDLLTADIASLAPGEARRSLLLTRTGRIRADMVVGRLADGFLLLQQVDQPEAIEALLDPYVLSSDVGLEDRSNRLTVAWIPRDIEAVGSARLRPSILGLGIDLVVPRHEAAGLRRALRGRGLVEAGPDALEAWRIVRGVPRMGADFDQRTLPPEAGLDELIDVAKGCFVGQEALATVRNLGHPPTVLRHLRFAGAPSAGTALFADGNEVGLVTSVIGPLDDGGHVGLARVRWDARGARLRTSQGVPSSDVGSMD